MSENREEILANFQVRYSIFGMSPVSCFVCSVLGYGDDNSDLEKHIFLRSCFRHAQGLKMSVRPFLYWKKTIGTLW